MKKNILIVISVILLLAVSGVALAEGVLTDDQKDFLDQKTQRVEELVEDGKITQEKADTYLEGFEQRLLEGTCQGDGANCGDGETCEFGLGADGECLGLGAGNGNGNCGQDGERGFGNGGGCGRK